MNGLVTLQSAHSVATTLARLTAALAAKSITIFAIVDHADGALQAGLDLRATTLVVFGNPAAGTPLMQEVQTAGIDLPLKVLIWEAANSVVHLTYNDPVWIAERHGLGKLQAVAAMSAALKALAEHAVAPG
ncbi:MAG: DUF302 domain-containing protein [Alphaproteobacteria bacterium]|nr:DUF302 domain-containing protein [Alphaproteobacteria bacterium]